MPLEVVEVLRGEIADLFEVSDTTLDQPQRGQVRFRGQFLVDTAVCFDELRHRFEQHGFTPLIRQEDEQIALIGLPVVFNPPRSNWVINLVLFILTIGSTLLVGAAQEIGPGETFSLWRGWPFSLSILLILGAHELGHYFAARYHKVAVTLPYFIPLPIISPVGTLGAFIQLRSPFKTKRELFDIGVAGPLGGLIFRLPRIFWGVATSDVSTIERGPSFVLEGNSIFYLWVKFIVHGELLPSFLAYDSLPFLSEFFRLLIGNIPGGGGTDILMSSIAFAAWFGLFVTAMNLIPVGQLDGGHVIYCLLGDKARMLGMALIGVMVLAGIFLWPGWLLWAGLTFFVIGPNHPPPLNDLIELGPTRKIIAYVMIFIFIIMFMPNPLQQFI